MTTLQAQWLGSIVAVASTCWAILWAFHTKRKELAWKRTEFIVSQSMLLDNDPELREAVAILYGRDPTFTLDDYLSSFDLKRIEDPETKRRVVLLDKYIEFVWRLAFARVVLRTLTTKDLWAFGVHFRTIRDHPGLKDHCDNRGWNEIIRAIEFLEKYWKADQALRTKKVAVT